MNEKCYSIAIGHDERLDFNEGIKYVGSDKTGAINCFIGTIRDTDTKIGSVVSLPIKAIFYEAYEAMMLKQVSEIIELTLQSQSQEGHVADDADRINRVYVAIRLGLVEVGEASIFISVSSTRRHTSHRATMKILEKIKSSVVIWKKVIYSDGSEHWAGADKSEASWLN